MEHSGPKWQDKRKGLFMKLPSASYFKFKRDEFTVQLRRNKRLEYFSKKRANIAVGYFEEKDCLSLQEKVKKLNTALSTKQPFNRALESLSSLKCLFSENKEAIAEGVKQGCVETLGYYLEWGEQVGSEAAWCLCNMVSSDKAASELVTQLGLVEVLVKLVREDMPVCSEHSLWTLGNIAGEGTGYRDILLNLKLHQKIHQSLDWGLKTTNLARAIGFCVSNLARGKPCVTNEEYLVLLSIAEKLLSLNDQYTLKDSLWCLCFLSDYPDSYIQELIKSSVIEQLHKLQKFQELKLSISRILGNCCTGNDILTENMLSKGILDIYKELVKEQEPCIRKEVMWGLSNIMAGTESQVKRLLNHPVIEDALLALSDSNLKVRKEACFIFHNLIVHDCPEELTSLVAKGLLARLSEAFNTYDESVVVKLLEICNVLLGSAEDLEEDLIESFEENGLIDIIEKTQTHKNPAVSYQAAKIIEIHFGIEETYLASPSLQVPQYFVLT